MKKINKSSFDALGDFKRVVEMEMPSVGEHPESSLLESEGRSYLRKLRLSKISFFVLSAMDGHAYIPINS